MKLIDYAVSAFAVVLSNPSVGPKQRIKMSFFYHQLAHKNYYQLEILLHFYQIHHHMIAKNPNVDQPQYHI